MTKDGEVSTAINDVETGEEYTLFLVEDAIGSFVGKIRDEYQQKLADVARHCFFKDVFSSSFEKSLLEYISHRYECELEFLWDKTPTNAILRRKDTNKWFGAMMIVDAKKLGIEGGVQHVINVHLPLDTVSQIVNGKNILPAYHMSKKSWVTILLDGTIPLEQLKEYVDISYTMAKNNCKQKLTPQ